MSSALLVVDVQHDFMSPALGALGDGYGERVAALLAAARSHGVPVLHAHSLFDPDGSDWMPRYRRRGRIPCVRGTPGAEVLAEAAPSPGEIVLVKQTFDAFTSTDLQDHLERLEVSRLLVAGLVTSTCVLLTAAAAMQRGFEVAVVEDVVADDPWMHTAVLDRYGFIFDRVLQSSAWAWAGVSE